MFIIYFLFHLKQFYYSHLCFDRHQIAINSYAWLVLCSPKTVIYLCSFQFSLGFVVSHRCCKTAEYIKCFFPVHIFLLRHTQLTWHSNEYMSAHFTNFDRKVKHTPKTQKKHKKTRKKNKQQKCWPFFMAVPKCMSHVRLKNAINATQR